MEIKKLQVRELGVVPLKKNLTESVRFKVWASDKYSPCPSTPAFQHNKLKPIRRVSEGYCRNSIGYCEMMISYITCGRGSRGGGSIVK